MSDQELRDLAVKAGVSPEWLDQRGGAHSVAPETLRKVLTALGFPCDTPDDLRHSVSRLEVPADQSGAPRLLTALVGQPFGLPAWAGRVGAAKVLHEDGSQRDIALEEGPHGNAVLPGLEQPGYHRIQFGDREVVAAVAPPRCFTVPDAAPDERIFGLTAQIYGLRRAGDGGIGHMGGVAALAEAAGRRGADALAISPMHALFSADPAHFGPYSPSSRLFYNPLHADPTMVFGAERVRDAVARLNIADEMNRLEQLDQIEWPLAAYAKLVLFRALFDGFEGGDLSSEPVSEVAADFLRFRAEGGDLLLQHARFEALHAARLKVDRGNWSWRAWPEEWRDPAGPAVVAFAAEQEREVRFHVFLQWLADRSLGAAQAGALRAGMRIGLISDLAIGMDGGGSHAWSRQRDVLVGLNIGAPPDHYNANGQNWGLTTFSPHALIESGFEPFIATLRAALKHAGGVRIDHVMGLMRLWLIPDGAPATGGAYVAYPVESLFRLIALESWRRRAIVIGEDLGTLPAGFRVRLQERGIAGMRVLRFERDFHGAYHAPDRWYDGAVGMTTIHDAPPTAGWWRGTDIDTRANLPGFLREGDLPHEQWIRGESRTQLWTAFANAGVANWPEPSLDTTDPVVDAAARYVAMTPCQLALLPTEDALGIVEQPNLPGTVDEYPNWRKRLAGDAAVLLDAPQAGPRIDAMKQRRNARPTTA